MSDLSEVNFEELGQPISLREFCSSKKIRLPCIVHFRQDATSLCGRYDVRANKPYVVLLKKRLDVATISTTGTDQPSISFKVPANAHCYSALNVRQASWLETVKDIASYQALPNIVRVSKGFTSREGIVVPAGCLLFLQKIKPPKKSVFRKSSSKVPVLKAKLEDGSVIKITPDCDGGFSTSPKQTQVRLATAIQHIPCPFNCKLRHTNRKCGKYPSHDVRVEKFEHTYVLFGMMQVDNAAHDTIAFQRLVEVPSDDSLTVIRLQPKQAGLSSVIYSTAWANYNNKVLHNVREVSAPRVIQRSISMVENPSYETATLRHQRHVRDVIATDGPDVQSARSQRRIRSSVSAHGRLSVPPRNIKRSSEPFSPPRSTMKPLPFQSLKRSRTQPLGDSHLLLCNDSSDDSLVSSSSSSLPDKEDSYTLRAVPDMPLASVSQVRQLEAPMVNPPQLKHISLQDSFELESNSERTNVDVPAVQYADVPVPNPCSAVDDDEIVLPSSADLEKEISGAFFPLDKHQNVDVEVSLSVAEMQDVDLFDPLKDFIPEPYDKDILDSICQQLPFSPTDQVSISANPMYQRAKSGQSNTNPFDSSPDSTNMSIGVLDQEREIPFSSSEIFPCVFNPLYHSSTTKKGELTVPNPFNERLSWSPAPTPHSTAGVFFASDPVQRSETLPCQNHSQSKKASAFDCSETQSHSYSKLHHHNDPDDFQVRNPSAAQRDHYSHLDTNFYSLNTGVPVATTKTRTAYSTPRPSPVLLQLTPNAMPSHTANTMATLTRDQEPSTQPDRGHIYSRLQWNNQERNHVPEIVQSPPHAHQPSSYSNINSEILDSPKHVKGGEPYSHVTLPRLHPHIQASTSQHTDDAKLKKSESFTSSHNSGRNSINLKSSSYQVELVQRAAGESVETKAAHRDYTIRREANLTYLTSLGVDGVSCCLSTMNLQQYIGSFVREHVDGKLFTRLTDDILRVDLGVSSQLHRMRLLQVASGEVDSRTFSVYKSHLV